MQSKLCPPSPWATRACADATTALARDLKQLAANIADCRACNGRWFAWRCKAEALHRFLAPRPVSMLAAVVAAFVALAVLS